MERVGRHDHFFELGGHSLLAVTLMERMRQRALFADIRTLFERPTLAALADAVAEARAAGQGELRVPPNGIPPGCTRILPEMLSLMPPGSLDLAQIDRIVAGVPGGAANVQDLYPLAPLQEGILFHHLLQKQGDPYLLSATLAFDSRARLDAFLAALRQGIARHDALRTAIAWEGLAEPVQVVWREATLVVEAPALAPDAGMDMAGALRRHADPRRRRIDLRQAPLMRGFEAHDPASGRWLLQLLMHHIVTDHTTLDVLFDEMALLRDGRGDELPPALPFRNFVAQARLGVSTEAHEAFFRAMLADVESPSAPYGLVDMLGDGADVDEARLPLDPALARRLRAQARRLGLSPSSLFHLAYAQVLARVSGRDDVVFGTALFGRMQGGQAADRVLGLFMNTLPLRLRLDERPLAQALRDTQAQLAALLHHEHAPLSLAQRCSGVPSSLPLFSAGFNFRHSRASQTPWPGMEVLHGEELSNFPAVLKVDDLGQDFLLTADTRAPIDPMRLCRYMHTALANLAQALDEAPQRPLRALEVLPDDERRLLVHDWNAATVPYATQSCIHELFERQAAARPDATALVVDAQRLSYAQLNARANRLAHQLLALGVKPDMRVAIALPRGVDMVVALLATLKAGGAYVPLDPAYPPERLAFMLDDSRPRVLITQAALQDRLPASRALMSAAVLELDAPQPSWSALPAYNPDPRALGLAPSHLAYVIYTSGSTGTPKGVMVAHEGLCSLAAGQVGSFAAGPDSRVLQFASFSFDGCIFELVLALAHGGSLHLVARELPLAGEDLLAALQQHRITHAILPPAVLATLPPQARLEDLRLLVMAGEAAPQALVRRFAPGRRLINGYGPTETTVCATLQPCVPGEVDEGQDPPIGRPIPNKRVYVLDAQGRPAPIGVAGEICIGGTGIARGYLNRAELSAERFVPDPFAAEFAAAGAGARMYRSGDLGRWRADGRLEFVGRIDQQVKLRGFRVELGEIEARLLRLAGVREAVVVAREDEPGEKRLVAYYVGGGEADADAATPEALREQLAASLPEYMVPAAYVRLAALPLTPNGKLDRRALPVPEDASFGLRRYEAPRGERETAMAQAWGELLGLERVGRGDHFFELGGHSLLAVQLISRLRQRLGLEMELSTLFAHPLLKDFAAQADEAARRDPASAVPALRPMSRPARVPVSFAQQRLWFIAQLGEAASQAYHMTGGLRLRGRVDEAALRAALDRIVQRHEALRTHFERVEGQVLQCVAPQAGFSLASHDLRGTPDPQAAVAHWARIEAQTPLDLGTRPLFRGRLLRLDEQTQVLLLTLHHIIADGWSMGVLARELGALYAAYARPGADLATDPLPPLPVQYADYALWQRDWLSGPVLRQQLDHWQRQLAGAPVCVTLPTDRPRPALQDFSGRSLGFALDRGLSDALKALSHRHGCTLFMTLLAGWAALCGRLAGQDEVVIGSPVANRGRAELEPLIGFFVNTLALRLGVAGAQSVAGLLAQVRETVLAAQKAQDLPFEQVVEALQPERSLAHAPVFQLMFAWQNLPAEPLQLPGLTLEELPEREDRSTPFELSLTLRESEAGIHGTLEYATALFDAASMERHLALLRRLLQGMVADDAQAVDRIAILDEVERHQLLQAWNDSDRPPPRAQGVHEMFEQQAALRPDATALVHQAHRLSYGDLNAEANRLAHYLRELGVAPDERVAVCLPRSPVLLVAILAVLKAGGAYVPLDPSSPPERRALMLRDCTPMALLTEQALLDGLQVPDGVQALALDVKRHRWASLSALNQDALLTGLRARHLAYVIYTSGSTGTPKGVMVEHRSLCNQVMALQQRYGLAPSDRVLQFAAASFDMSVEEIFGALCSGATLVLATPDWVSDAQGWCALARDAGLTVANLPTLFWQQIALAPQAPLPASLRLLAIGGEAVSEAALAAWWARPGHRPALFNAYGPTEATVNASVLACHPQAHPRSIGHPLANMRLYVLDRHGEPVPVGVPGEIHIGGAGVARGYLNRESLTRERFVADPFAGEPGARLYRSGDLGRWLPDGTVEFLGRNDHQVKIRGFRVELGEIEARLAREPAVREALVLARDDLPGHAGDRRLVAYLLAGDGVDLAALRASLARDLPEVMLPAAFVCLPAWPLTPHGKLDRRALPLPDGAQLAAPRYEAPQGAVEQTLARLWAELLGCERVGRQDHFFALGGHSLLAVQLLERMRREGLGVDIRALFASPRLAALAEAVVMEPQPGAPGVRVPSNAIPPGCRALRPEMLPLVALEPAQIEQIVAQVPGGAANVQDIYPLAPLQQGILFHHLLQREGDAYLSSATLAFDSRARLDAFVQALRRVVARHDVLRTAVLWQGLPEPVQVVWREAELAVEELALDGDVAAALRAQADPAHTRLDLRRAPLLRLLAAPDAAQGRWLLQLLEHHLVTDHATLDLLFHELAMIQAGREQELPEPVPFRNFVAQARLGVSQAEHEAMFTELLGDVDGPTAPYGLMDVQGDGREVREAQLSLDADLARRLRRLARAQGVSCASLFHWAWGQVLARSSGRDDVVFGTVLFGRLQGGQGSARALGLFINTLPLRIRLGAVPVQQSLQNTHETLLRLLRHEHAPLSLAQRCSALPASTPLFSALLNYRHSPQAQDDAQPGLKGVALVYAQERSNYPFILSVDDLGEGFSLSAQIAEPIGAARVCAQMLQALDSLADALERAPQTPSYALEVLPQAERQQLLVDFNASRHAGPRELCLHQLVEQQADLHPQAIAVAHEHGSLSYRALDDEANRIAQHLRRLGLRPDERVAICLPRGAALVVAMLAVLKAGGAYVPLDPAHPRERLAFMLADALPMALLTYGALLEGLDPPAALPVLRLDDPQPPWRDEPATRPDAAAVGLMPRHLAYVIYTSGSTGTPKGVMVEQGGLVNLVSWHCQRFPLRVGERSSGLAGLAFDACSWEVWPPLCMGATLALAPADADPQQLLTWWEGQVLHSSFLVTALGELALQRRRFNPALRHLLIGGERLNHRPAADLPFELVHCYGPTETTVIVSAGRLEPDLGGHAVPHIGRPIANAKIYLLDAHGQLVPRGAVGEICIGGPGVARGYLNRPELTRERFLPNPFPGELGGRLYRSGDLARWGEDGTLVFLGRNDHQVKIRGLRVELGEIEALLRQQPGVRDAVVLAREDDAGHSGDRRLVAYVVAEADTETGTDSDTPPAALESATLREALARRLPEALVPGVVLRLAALPLTPNGKLDRQALPAPRDHDAAVRPAYAAPQGERERLLAALWAPLLQRERVGRDDDFFALGGHSLLTIQLVERLREQGLQVELRGLFEAPRLKDMAERLSAVAPASALPEEVVPLRLGGTRRPLFFLHEPTGEVLSYERLSRHLGEDLPIYGLRASRADAATQRDLVALARRHRDAIRQVQPQGPYRLAGWSGGGLLAYEIAHQLLAEDEAVEFIGLIDSARPGYKPAEPIPDELGMRWVFLEVYAAYLDPSLDMLAIRALQEHMDLEQAVAHCRELGWLPDSFRLDELVWRSARFGRLVHACMDYRPPPLPMPLHLFTGEPVPGSDPSMGWEALAGRHLRLRPIGGTHKTVMEEPHSPRLAAQIRRALDEAEADPALSAAAPVKALIPLQSGERGVPPLYCAPGAGGNVTCFLPLLQALGPRTPVIGLQSRGHDGGSVPHGSVEAAARAHVAELKAAQPQGPYRLLGHSFGGWVVFEMARRLAAAGDTVAQLVLVDCEPPGPVRASDRLRTLALFVELLEMDRGQPLRVGELAGLDEAAQEQRLLAALVAAGVMPARTPVHKLQGLLRVFGQHLNTGYQPPSGYDGPVLLLQAERSETERDAHDPPRLSNAQKLQAWRAWAPRLEAVLLSGSNHMSVLKDPHAGRIAALLLRQTCALPEGAIPVSNPISEVK
ncbi:amino acid adenylation domain-containing protein [Pelomonas sp. CA6]|nr:amino acid adenylation domain-containing protein [Pelomonas sp. CA6]